MPAGKQTDTRTDEEIGSALDLPMRSLDLVLKKLADTAADEASDEMTATRIVETILQAETWDEVLGNDVIHVEDLDYDDKGFSKNIELLGGTVDNPGLKIQPSSFGGKGLHYYAVCPAKMGDMVFAFVTSSANICAQLVKGLQLGSYPATVRVRKAHSRPREDAPTGYDVYKFTRPKVS